MRKMILSLVMFLSTLTIVAQSNNVESRHRRGPQRREHVCVIPPYSEDEIAEITAYVKKQNFDSDMMPIAMLFVKIRPITVKGLASIAKLFSFDDKRRDFLLFAYDYCVDKENFFSLRNTFSFSSEAEKMYKNLGM